jgi:hypothetical protein
MLRPQAPAIKACREQKSGLSDQPVQPPPASPVCILPCETAASEATSGAPARLLKQPRRQEPRRFSQPDPAPGRAIPVLSYVLAIPAVPRCGYGSNPPWQNGCAERLIVTEQGCTHPARRPGAGPICCMTRSRPGSRSLARRNPGACLRRGARSHLPPSERAVHW